MKNERQSASSLFLFLGLLQITLIIATVIAPALTPTAKSAGSPQPFVQPSDLLLLTVDPLVRYADLIVRAQVTASESRWNSNHTLIETGHTLAVRYTLLGESTPEMLVYTDGGFLPEEGLGMRSSHTAAFVPGEEVLVFLKQRPAGYQTVRGETGKFTVLHTVVGNAHLRQQTSLAQLLLSIQNAAARQGRPTTLPENWPSYEPTTFAQQLTVPNQPMVDPKWPGEKPQVKATVNLNSTHIGEQGGSEAQFLQAIKNALRAWSVVESAEFTLLYQGASAATSTGFNNKSEILFMRRGLSGQLGQAQIWYTNSGVIVEADLWINDDYLVDATGAPQANEIDVESVALHELGHWAPLGHVDAAEAVMYPVLGNGVRKAALAGDDINRLTALYPCPNVPCIDPVYANDGTATQNPTPDPIILATATPTPSNTPTVTTTPSATLDPTLTPTATPLVSGTLPSFPTPWLTTTPRATADSTLTPAATATLIPPVATAAAPTNLFLPLVTR